MTRLNFSCGIVLSLLSIIFAGCGNEANQAQYDALSSRCDSLQRVNDEMSAFMTTISASIDSVLIQEGAILNYSNGETPLSPREQLRRNVDTYESIINRQKERLSQLEKSLEASLAANSDAEKMKNIIAGLRSQIEQKDAMIASLRQNLSDSNTDIASLRDLVSSLSQNIVSLNEVTEAQEEALSIQDNMLNTAYVKIGTKKELEQSGVLKGGGFLRKKQLDISNFDASQFEQIDIRTATSFTIPGKKPTILTQMPAESYSIKTEGKSSILTIVDPTAFWSVSNFLIIQY